MNGDLKEKNNRSEKSWRYVHCEMNDPERLEFERLMSTDEALRRETEQIRRMNGSLRELMPLTEQTEETLADQLLKEWERATIQPSLSARKKIGAFFEEGVQTLLEAWRWRSYGWRSLATVAATILLVVGIRAYWSGPLEWARPEIAYGIQYRGEGEPERAPIHTRDDILNLHKALRKSVEKKIAERESTEHTRSWRGREKKWRLAAKYQELPNGGTQAQVTLYSSRHGAPEKEWSRYYPDLRSWGDQVDELGDQIVKELVTNEPEQP
jgi:hypothetical protein